MVHILQRSILADERRTFFSPINGIKKMFLGCAKNIEGKFEKLISSKFSMRIYLELRCVQVSVNGSTEWLKKSSWAQNCIEDTFHWKLNYKIEKNPWNSESSTSAEDECKFRTNQDTVIPIESANFYG